MRKNSGVWAPPCGGKRSKLFNRPLIPMLGSFAGGIFAVHTIFPLEHGFALPLIASILICLVTILFLSPRIRVYVLILIFFLTGALLGPEKHHPSRLTSLAKLHKSAVIEGTVLDPPKIIDGKTAKMNLRAQELILKGGAVPIDEDIVLTVYDNAPKLEPGDKIRFPARLKPFKNFNNPGNYNYEKAMKLKGLICSASVSDGRRIVPMGPGHLPFLRGMIETIQKPVRDLFKKQLNPRNFALFRALILGERQGLGPALREPFNQTGLGHMLAVSGLHIGLVAWAVFFLFKWVLSRSYRLALMFDIRKISAFLTAFPVIGYTLLAGFQVSSQRAMIRILTFLGSMILEERGKYGQPLPWPGSLSSF